MKVLQQNFCVIGQPEAELHIVKFEEVLKQVCAGLQPVNAWFLIIASYRECVYACACLCVSVCLSVPDNI